MPLSLIGGGSFFAAPEAPANNAPVWDSIPTITLERGGTASVVGYASDPDDDALTFSLASGSLPSGVTFDNGVFTATGAATLGESGDLVVEADDGQ